MKPFVWPLLLLLLAGCTATPEHRSDLADQGYRALQAGEYGRAEKLLNAAIAERPDDPYALLNLAALHHNSGLHDSARTLYRRVIEMAPEGDVPEGTYLGDGSRKILTIARQRLNELERLEAAQRQRTAEREAAAREAAERAAAEREAARRAAAQEAERRQAAAARAPAGKAALRSFWVQTGYFESRPGLEAHRKLLIRHRQLLASPQVRLLRRGEGVRVQLGPFPSMEAAQRVCGRLKGVGGDCFVLEDSSSAPTPPPPEPPQPTSPRWGRYQ